MIHIMFNLIMIHSGQYFLLGVYETYEECHAVQIKYEEDPKYKGDKFACPYVQVRDV
jgi:hypothetical protein